MRFRCWVASVVRAPWLVIAAWIAVGRRAGRGRPPLTKVVESQTVQPLPPKRTMAAAQQMAKDFGESAQNILVVVLTDNRGLQPGDQDAYRKTGRHVYVATPTM